MPPSMPHAAAVSPQKRRHLFLSGSPLPILSHKKSHPGFPSSPSPISSNLPITLLYTMDNDEDTGVPPDIPTVEFSASRPPTLMQRLTQESHNERLAQQEEMKSDKGTDIAYNRHLKRYETWWDLEQIRRINELEDTIQPPLINTFPNLLIQSLLRKFLSS